MYLGRALAFANEPEQARHAFQRQETAAQKISTQGWEELAIFALDSKLRVDVDEVEGLGEFVELEILTESPEMSQELLELARNELALEKLEPRTYLELILDKKT